MLLYIFVKWDNNWSLNDKKAEQQSITQTLKKSSNTNTVTKNFYSIRDQIIKTVIANQFPDTITFDKAISSLN